MFQIALLHHTTTCVQHTPLADVDPNSSSQVISDKILIKNKKFRFQIKDKRP